MSFKKKEHPEFYARKVERKTNTTHHINTWSEWCEICEEYDEDPHTCTSVSLDLGGGNWEDFEFDGSPQKED